LVRGSANRDWVCPKGKIPQSPDGKKNTGPANNKTEGTRKKPKRPHTGDRVKKGKKGDSQNCQRRLENRGNRGRR